MDSPLASQIIAANRRLFAQQAAVYDRLELTMQPRHQAHLLRDVLWISRLIPTASGRKPRMLDCGIGTGALAMLFLDQGFEVVGVDLSAEMLAQCAAKVSASPSLRLVHAEVMDFLEMESTFYDVVGCCSFLHHVPDYLRVLQAMADQVRPGGWLYVAWEPLPVQRYASLYWTISRIEYALALLLHDRPALREAVRRKLRRLMGRPGLVTCAERSDSAPLQLADYHVSHGLDLPAIRATLEERGFRVEITRSLTQSRTWLSVLLLERLLQFPTHFSLCARRLASEGKEIAAME